MKQEIRTSQKKVNFWKQFFKQIFVSSAQTVVTQQSLYLRFLGFELRGSVRYQIVDVGCVGHPWASTKRVYVGPGLNLTLLHKLNKFDIKVCIIFVCNIYKSGIIKLNRWPNPDNSCRVKSLCCCATVNNGS